MYFFAKIGADTAEKEGIFAKNWQLPYGSHRGAGASTLASRAAGSGTPRSKASTRGFRHSICWSADGGKCKDSFDKEKVDFFQKEMFWDYKLLSFHFFNC